MTTKLYYIDAYIKEFTATVLSSDKTDGGYLTVLDRTAFFPNEGGQAADTGTVGGVRVLDVSESSGVITHMTEAPLPIGAAVECKIDFDVRFQKMQLHTAEHILCGIIHSLFGYENVGFHLVDGTVTFDISAPMSREDVDRVERLANVAVFENRRVNAREYSADELKNIEYRAKIDGANGLRIVEIEGVDKCACCAPHVSYTGEIGLIKILDFERHRGGTRLYLLAGGSAYLDVKNKYDSIKALSGALSVPKEKVSEGVETLIAERDSLVLAAKKCSLNFARALAEYITPSERVTLVLLPFSLDSEAMRELANEMMAKTEKPIAVVSFAADTHKYVLAQRDSDISSLVRAVNAALSGRGGGRGSMASGSFSATREQIVDYFASL